MDGHPRWLFRPLCRLINKKRNHLAAIITALHLPVCYSPHPYEAGG